MKNALSRRAHKGDIDHAISDYDQALRLNPSLASAFYERGNAYALKGSYDYAIKDYDRCAVASSSFRPCQRLAGPFNLNEGHGLDSLRTFDLSLFASFFSSSSCRPSLPLCS